MSNNIDTQWQASSFDNFVTNLPYHMIKGQEDIKPDMVRSVFTKRPWNPAEGDRVSFDSYSLPQYATRSDGENSTAHLMSIGEGDTMTVKQNEYSARFLYTHKMDTFDKEKVANSFARTIVGGINRTVDMEMTHKILTDAEDSTYTPRGKNYSVDWVCADDVALAGTHTAGGVSFSTEYTASENMSGDSIEAAEQAAREAQRNHLGESMDIDMDMLGFSKVNAMIKKAFEIFGSQKDPATANNTVNIFHTDWGKKIAVFNHGAIDTDGTYLTTDTARYRYFLADSRYMENWQYQVSDSPKIQLKDTDIDTVMKVILGIGYNAFATVQPQGYTIHRQNVGKPVVTD